MWKLIIANTTQYFFFFLNTTFPPKERSVNVFCVQTETALSGRH